MVPQLPPPQHKGPGIAVWITKDKQKLVSGLKPNTTVRELVKALIPGSNPRTHGLFQTWCDRQTQHLRPKAKIIDIISSFGPEDLKYVRFFVQELDPDFKEGTSWTAGSISSSSCGSLQQESMDGGQDSLRGNSSSECLPTRDLSSESLGSYSSLVGRETIEQRYSIRKDSSEDNLTQEGIQQHYGRSQQRYSVVDNLIRQTIQEHHTIRTTTSSSMNSSLSRESIEQQYTIKRDTPSTDSGEPSWIHAPRSLRARSHPGYSYGDESGVGTNSDSSSSCGGSFISSAVRRSLKGETVSHRSTVSNKPHPNNSSSSEIHHNSQNNSLVIRSQNNLDRIQSLNQSSCHNPKPASNPLHQNTSHRSQSNLSLSSCSRADESGIEKLLRFLKGQHVKMSQQMNRIKQMDEEIESLETEQHHSRVAEDGLDYIHYSLLSQSIADLEQKIAEGQQIILNEQSEQLSREIIEQQDSHSVASGSIIADSSIMAEIQKLREAVRSSIEVSTKQDEEMQKVTEHINRMNEQMQTKAKILDGLEKELGEDGEETHEEKSMDEQSVNVDEDPENKQTENYTKSENSAHNKHPEESLANWTTDSVALKADITEYSMLVQNRLGAGLIENILERYRSNIQNMEYRLFDSVNYSANDTHKSGSGSDSGVSSPDQGSSLGSSAEDLQEALKEDEQSGSRSNNKAGSKLSTGSVAPAGLLHSSCRTVNDLEMTESKRDDVSSMSISPLSLSSICPSSSHCHMMESCIEDSDHPFSNHLDDTLVSKPDLNPDSKCWPQKSDSNPGPNHQHPDGSSIQSDQDIFNASKISQKSTMLLSTSSSGSSGQRTTANCTPRAPLASFDSTLLSLRSQGSSVQQSGQLSGQMNGLYDPAISKVTRYLSLVGQNESLPNETLPNDTLLSLYGLVTKQTVLASTPVRMKRPAPMTNVDESCLAPPAGTVPSKASSASHRPLTPQRKVAFAEHDSVHEITRYSLQDSPQDSRVEVQSVFHVYEEPSLEDESDADETLVAEDQEQDDRENEAQRVFKYKNQGDLPANRFVVSLHPDPKHRAMPTCDENMSYQNAIYNFSPSDESHHNFLAAGQVSKLKRKIKASNTKTKRPFDMKQKLKDTFKLAKFAKRSKTIPVEETPRPGLSVSSLQEDTFDDSYRYALGGHRTKDASMLRHSFSEHDVTVAGRDYTDVTMLRSFSVADVGRIGYSWIEGHHARDTIIEEDEDTFEQEEDKENFCPTPKIASGKKTTSNGSLETLV